MIKLHSNPISRENKDRGLHQPNPMFLTRTIKMSKPTVNGRIVPQNCGRKGRLIGPEICGGIDGIGFQGRVERERLWERLGKPIPPSSQQSTAKGDYSRLSFQSIIPPKGLFGHELPS